MKVYIININSITNSFILNIEIRPLVTEYALMIKLVDGTSSAHSFNPYAYFGHSWSYFDIQNLRLVILYGKRQRDTEIHSNRTSYSYFILRAGKMISTAQCPTFDHLTLTCKKRFILTASPLSYRIKEQEQRLIGSESVQYVSKQHICLRTVE